MFIPYRILGKKKRKGSSVSIKPKSSVSDYVPPKLRELILPSAFGIGKPKSMSSGWGQYGKEVELSLQKEGSRLSPLQHFKMSAVCSLLKFVWGAQRIKASQGPNQSHLHWEMQHEMDRTLSYPYASNHQEAQEIGNAPETTWHIKYQSLGDPSPSSSPWSLPFASTRGQPVNQLVELFGNAEWEALNKCQLGSLEIPFTLDG